MNRIITIDGPSSSGKSSIAKTLAKKFNGEYLETGAIYRTLTYAVIESEINLDDDELILSLIPRIKVQFFPDLKSRKILLDGLDVSDKIRSEKVTKNVSKVSAYSKVRQALIELQRNAINENIITFVEGRDMGNVIFPDANLKFYLTADALDRATRRAFQENNKEIQTVYDDILNRDKMDSERKASPLMIPKDAILIDSTDASFEETLNVFIRLIDEHNNGMKLSNNIVFVKQR